MNESIISELVKAHTRYEVECECGVFLLSRRYGRLSARDAWEQHFIEVLSDYLLDRRECGWFGCGSQDCEPFCAGRNEEDNGDLSQDSDTV